MTDINYQSSITSVLDDLSLKFFANYREPVISSANADGSVPYVWCDVPLNNAIPEAILNNRHLLVRLTDRIHEVMSSIHSEWSKFSVQCFDMTDGKCYLVLIHENACIETLCNFVSRASEDGLLDDEMLSEWLDVQTSVDPSKSTFPQLYEGLKKLNIGGMPLRVWRDHSFYYEDEAVSEIVADADIEGDEGDEKDEKDETAYLNSEVAPIDTSPTVEVGSIEVADKVVDADKNGNHGGLGLTTENWAYVNSTRDKSIADQYIIKYLCGDDCELLENLYRAYLNRPSQCICTIDLKSLGNGILLDFLKMELKSEGKTYTLYRKDTEISASDVPRFKWQYIRKNDSFDDIGEMSDMIERCWYKYQSNPVNGPQARINISDLDKDYIFDVDFSSMTMKEDGRTYKIRRVPVTAPKKKLAWHEM